MHILRTRLCLYRYRDTRIAAENVDDLHASRAHIFFRILIVPEVTNRLKEPVFSCAAILPVMLKGLALMPVKIHGPEVNEVKTAFDHSLLQGFQSSMSLGKTSNRPGQASKMDRLPAPRSPC